MFFSFSYFNAKLCLGCSYPGLLSAMEDCLTNHYVERFRGLMRRLEKRKTASHSWTILQQAISLNQVKIEKVPFTIYRVYV